MRGKNNAFIIKVQLTNDIADKLILAPYQSVIEYKTINKPVNNEYLIII